MRGELCIRWLTSALLTCFIAGCSQDGGGSGSEEATSTTPAAATVPAPTQPSPQAYTVTISVSGSGTVSDSGNGINCTATCSVQVAANRTLTLSQTAGAGAAFSGWSGACSGVAGCSTTVTGSTSVTATFNAVTATPPPATPTPTPTPAPPAPTPGSSNVTVQVHASGAVSFGLPFERGALSDPLRIRVLASGSEVPVFAKALARYPDGSLRAALVQFDGTAGNVVVDWSVARTRQLNERPVEWVDVTDNLTGTVKEPRVFVTLPAAYLCRAALRTNCLPLATSPLDEAYANFARTAINEVTDPGFTVPMPYASSSGHVDLSGEEPWLFDRALSFFSLYARTGELKWLRQAHRHAQKYASQVNSIGIFALSSYDHDLKYSYAWSPFVDYLLTGDSTMLPVIDRVAQAGAREWQTAYSTSLGFWTERHHTYALLSAVIHYEATGNQTSLALARSLMDTLVSMSNNAAKCPLHTITQHEGVANDARMMCSPWMTAMLAEAVYRYWMTSADDRAVTWLAGLGDYLVNHAIYDGGLESTELAGRKMTWYLAGVGMRIEDQRGWGDMEHACDAAGLAARAVWAKGRLGQDGTSVRNAVTALLDTCTYVLGYWTRSTTSLPKYRLNPPRKFNWWFGSTSDATWLLSN